MLQHVDTDEQMIAPDPSIVLSMDSPARWSFKFSHSEGNGFIRVGEGCDYNPLCMVEALFHQLEKADLMTDLNATSGSVHINIEQDVRSIDDLEVVFDEEVSHDNWLSDEDREDLA